MPKVPKLVKEPCEPDVHLEALPSGPAAAVLKKGYFLTSHLLRVALARHQGERGEIWEPLRDLDLFRPQFSHL